MISIPDSVPDESQGLELLELNTGGTMKAIETRYKGYRFRSRLEARWAVYLDACGLRWEYEKEGFDLGDGVLYLPDFWLPQVRMWAEVKPEKATADELAKATRLYQQTGSPVLLLIGTPAFCSYCAVESVFCGDWDCERCRRDDYHAVGYMDYVVSNYHSYPDTEHRFYSNTGGNSCDDGLPAPLEGLGFEDDVIPAVMAARAARFEHGETP